MFYGKLFRALDVTLPKAATGRRGFPKEAMVCAFIIMKCEGFSQITDLADYLNNNRLIAHYCGFSIMKPLPSYWTYDRFLKKLNNRELKDTMAQQVKKLYELGIVDASFIGLDSTPVAVNTKQNNSKSFAKDKFKPESHPKVDPDCALGVHTASSQHNERRYEFYWGYKNHVLVDCISGLPLYEWTAPSNTVLPLRECTFLGDKGYDAKHIYNLVRDVYEGGAVIPLNERNARNLEGCPLAALSATPALPCIRTARPRTMDAHARNFAVPVTTRTGTMERITGAAPSTIPFPLTAAFPLTGIPPVSKKLTLCALNVSATIPALRLPARGAFGSATAPAPLI